MCRRPPSATLTDTVSPYTMLFRSVSRHGLDRDDQAGTAAATNPRYVPAGTTRGTGTGAVHAALRERFAISLRMRLAGSRAEANPRRPSAHPHARPRGETVEIGSASCRDRVCTYV